MSERQIVIVALIAGFGYLLVIFPLAMWAGRLLQRLDAHHMQIPPAVRRIPTQRKSGDQS